MYALSPYHPLSLIHLCLFRLHFEEFERKMRDLTVSWMLPAFWGLPALFVSSVHPHQPAGHNFLKLLPLAAKARSAGCLLHPWMLVPLAVP